MRISLVKTRELDRQHDVIEQAQIVADFYDWLAEQGIQLMSFKTLTGERPCPILSCLGGKHNNGSGRRCMRCGGTGMVAYETEEWVQDRRNPGQLLADFFNIDLGKIEAERRAILAELRLK